MYHREGKNSEFAQILNEALKDTDKKTDPHLFMTQDERIQAYNALASYYIFASERENGLEKQEKMIEQGMKNIYSADQLNLKIPETWITKSFYYIASGQIR